MYDNELYQSAGYYFNQVLSISTILLESTKSTEETSDYLTDIKPDYHLEASIYFIKCQLIIDYYQSESCVDLNNETKQLSEDELIDSAKLQQSVHVGNETTQMESMLVRLTKNNQQITANILKWKLTETNRASFKFNLAEVEKLKEDSDCERLKQLLELSTECLLYVCYQLGQYEQCLFYLERNRYLLNLDSQDLNVKLQSTLNMDVVKILETGQMNLLENYEQIKQILAKLNDPLVVFKFAFNSKLLYVFYVESDGSISLHERIKLSLLLNKQGVSVGEVQRKLCTSELDFLAGKFDNTLNEWVRANLNEIECRDINPSDTALKNVRLASRAKEKRFHNKLNGKPAEEMQNLCENLLQNNSNRSVEAAPQQQKKTLKKINDLNSAAELDSIFHKLLHPMFIQPLITKLDSFRKKKTNLFLNISIDSVYSRLLNFGLNHYNHIQTPYSSYEATRFEIYFNLVLDSFLLGANALLASIANETRQTSQLQQACEKVKHFPLRVKSAAKQTNETNSIKVLKSSITPQYTCNPRLAKCMLNERPELDYVLIRNDHVERAACRLAASVSTLISETLTGTEAKRSTLQVIEYKQIYKIEKCSVIGCPDMPAAYLAKSGVDKFLKHGFDQLCLVGKLLYVDPVFGNLMSKQELLNQLETSKLIFLSTVSSNEADSALICSETLEYPSSPNEIDKYCKLTSADLNLIDMSGCHLLVLNCYSTVGHVPRFKLAKKFLARGCRCVLVVLTPLTNELTTQFYVSFFENLRENTHVSVAYSKALSKLSSDQGELVKSLISCSFCLIGSAHTKVSINEIAKVMVQVKIDQSLNELQANTNYLNLEPAMSILTSNFKSWLERTLVNLQILFKLLMHQLIAEKAQSFKNNDAQKKLFYYVYDLVSKAIFYMKNKKVIPEQVSELIAENQTALNILTCLGFSLQRTTVGAVRDQPDKKFIAFPDNRFLDLNIRTVHILSALIELCFEQSIDTPPKSNDYSIRLDEASYMNQFYNQSFVLNDETNEYKIKMIIFNLQALLPVQDTNLLTCLIDIIALTKFSSEIILSLTDYSVFYAFNYYETHTKANSKEYVNLLDKDIDAWSRRGEAALHRFEKKPSLNADASMVTLPPSTNHSMKFNANNKVANFLFAIGFEVVGEWLRFNNVEFYRRIIELMLKLFTSVALDRDMSLYKELNINVLGQRSAVTRDRYSRMRTTSSLSNDSPHKVDDHFKVRFAFDSNLYSVNETFREPV